MAEYIKREAALEESVELYHWCGYEDRYGDFVPVDAIQRIPAADVAPARHGRWERTADGAALCTACKQKMNPSQYGYAFCSLCGAKMDGGVDGG